MTENIYTREQVYEATLKYFKGDELAATVWIDKYCLKQKRLGQSNDIFDYYELTPDDMHRRLAKEFARVESKFPNPMSEDEIYNLLKDFKFIVPQGSPMAGIGNPFAKTSISNCFVIGGQPDSYGGIMNLDEEGAQLMKRRGGVGNSLNFLRPSGAMANGTPLGPNAGMPLYMDRYSNTTREVQQDGRRGARMLSASVKHPDIEKFIDKKMIPGSVTGANVSVEISDEFVKACNEDHDFFQVFPIDKDIYEVLPPAFTNDRLPESIDPDHILESLEYDKLYEGRVIGGIKTYYKKIKPQKIQDKLVYNAWAAAEPGSLFWDKIINESPAKGYGEVWKELSTNPCGEVPLPAYDSCRLLVINLMGFVINAYGDNPMLHDEVLKDVVKKAQRLMDDVVELEIEKINIIIESIKSKKFEDKYQQVELDLWTKILNMAQQGRRTGLGITAEGDMIAAIGYKYGTPLASKFSEMLHQLIATASYESSIELAEERGAFPIWDLSKDEESGFINRMFNENELMTDELYERYTKTGRRNIANLTIAPTGSVSILTQTTSGIEPLFSPYYFRKKKIVGDEKHDWIDEVGDKWIEYPVFHYPFVDWFKEMNEMSFEEALTWLSSRNADQLNKLFIVSPYFQATAQDVDYVEKVRMQGAVQKWVDHSISVTVNMPEEVTVDIVAAVYKVAHESGCKGVTVYRDNSRGNVLSTSSIKDKTEEGFDYVSAQKRPDKIDCDIYHKTKSGEDFIILVGKLDDKPYEIFAIPDIKDVTHFSRHKKSGQILKRKKGVYDLYDGDELLVEDITSHMIESEQNSTRNFSAMLRHRMDPKFIIDMISRYASISSFHKVIGKVLKSYIKESEVGTPCPEDECGGTMVMTEGCMKCPDCGYAHCG